MGLSFRRGGKAGGLASFRWQASGKIALLSLVLLAFNLLVTLVEPALADPQFNNPVVSRYGDPWIIRQGDYFYLSGNGDGPSNCNNNNSVDTIYIIKTATISGASSAPCTTVWNGSSNPDGYSKHELWAPELHYINNTWYLYYTADDADNNHHRMHVLQSTSSDPTDASGWFVPDTGQPGGLLVDTSGDCSGTPAGCWSIDANVFSVGNQLYIVWSGTPYADNTYPQNIYLATMSDPLHINSARVRISTPDYGWEKSSQNINEGPVGFQHAGKTYITYSGSGCWTADYAVGLLTNTGSNLLEASNWHKTGPIFSKYGSAYGAASFVPIQSADGREDWFMYHATGESGGACDGRRSGRAQRLYWRPDGSPLPGLPIATSTALTPPSGENGSAGTPDPFDQGWGPSFAALSGVDTSNSLGGGQKVGDWSINGWDKANSTSLGSGWHSLYNGNPNFEDYTISADVQWVATGTTASYPKYGIYASYLDENNHAEVFIDKNYGVLATHAVVNGSDQGWQNSSLPGGFDYSQYHTLRVQKSGNNFTFYLDGNQQQQRNFSLLKGQYGLVTEDTQANYKNVSDGTLIF